MAEPTRRSLSFIDRINNAYSATTMDVRAENAYAVSVKFMELIERSVSDPEAQRKLMSAWFKSVRDKDFRKFKRALRRYDNILRQENQS